MILILTIFYVEISTSSIADSKGLEGSGLGLAIVREIAEKHGGQV
jgi:signal transduction histidine kinase